MANTSEYMRHFDKMRKEGKLKYGPSAMQKVAPPPKESKWHLPPADMTIHRPAHRKEDIVSTFLDKRAPYDPTRAYHLLGAEANYIAEYILETTTERDAWKDLAEEYHEKMTKLEHTNDQYEKIKDSYEKRLQERTLTVNQTHILNTKLEDEVRELKKENLYLKAHQEYLRAKVVVSSQGT